MNLRTLVSASLAFTLFSCTNQRNTKSRGPIVLGDSSTIVTETNLALLQDQIPDLKPVLNADTAVAPATTTLQADTAKPTDTASKPATNQPQPQTGNGLSVPFKEVSIFIPGIATRSYGKPDLQKARGATYELTGGKLAGAQMRFSGGQVTKVSQRYQTMLVLANGNDRLALESLPKYASSWQPVRLSGATYTISGLEGATLEYKMPGQSALNNAVQQAARRQRLSRAETQKWLNAIRNLRSPNQAPAQVALRSATWRIEGKGFSKELRIDVPVK